MPVEVISQMLAESKRSAGPVLESFICRMTFEEQSKDLKESQHLKTLSMFSNIEIILLTFASEYFQTTFAQSEESCRAHLSIHGSLQS